MAERKVKKNNSRLSNIHSPLPSESSRIEYKRELNDKLEREVVAFLNSGDGGVIYIGIDKSGKIFGVNDPDSVQLAIKDRLKNNIRPSNYGLVRCPPGKP